METTKGPLAIETTEKQSYWPFADSANKKKRRLILSSLFLEHVQNQTRTEILRAEDRSQYNTLEKKMERKKAEKK